MEEPGPLSKPIRVEGEKPSREGRTNPSGVRTRALKYRLFLKAHGVGTVWKGISTRNGCGDLPFELFPHVTPGVGSDGWMHIGCNQSSKLVRSANTRDTKLSLFKRYMVVSNVLSQSSYISSLPTFPNFNLFGDNKLRGK